MNITSPSSSLEQTNFAFEDWGTNPSDSSINFRFHTYSVAMEANGSGCGCGLELVFPGLPSSCSMPVSLTWDSSRCLGWIFEMFIPNNSTVSKLQTAKDLQGDALLHYDAEMELIDSSFYSK
ncbi:hypothetical protein Tco_0144674 [Tanacetum coccineum]